MTARSSWQGFLQFNLISVPVRAFSATKPGEGKIHFHMIHAGCGERIHYQKVCPIHGEVSNDEIVSGRKNANGELVTVKKEELKKLKEENDRVLNIDVFVSSDLLDPVYGSGRSYYLTPDGKVARKPYAVLQKTMADLDRCALARIVFSGKRQVALVRPTDNLLMMTLLYFEDQIKKSTAFDDDVQTIHVSAEERRLAETLIETATSEKLDYSKYKNLFKSKVENLLASKRGEPARRRKSEAAEEPDVINLMDALRASLEQAKKSPSRGNGKPARRSARKRTG